MALARNPYRWIFIFRQLCALEKDVGNVVDIAVISVLSTLLLMLLLLFFL